MKSTIVAALGVLLVCQKCIGDDDHLHVSNPGKNIPVMHIISKELGENSNDIRRNSRELRRFIEIHDSNGVVVVDAAVVADGEIRKRAKETNLIDDL